MSNFDLGPPPLLCPYRTLAEAELGDPMAELGLVPQLLLDAVLAGHRAGALVGAHHFDSERRHRERIETMADLTRHVVPLGGRKFDRLRGVLLPCLRRVVIAVQGDRHTGSGGSTPALPTRPVSERVLREMAQQVTDLGPQEPLEQEPGPEQLADPMLEIWLLLVRTFPRRRAIALEIGRPLHVRGRRVVAWGAHVQLPEIKLDGSGVKRDEPPSASEGGGETSLPTVDVERRGNS